MWWLGTLSTATPALCSGETGWRSTRDFLVRQRTQTGNAIRGHMYGATIWMGRRDDQDDEIGGRDLAKMDCESVRCKGGIF